MSTSIRICSARWIFLAKRAGLSERISFREESDEASPFRAERVDVALSFTVMEEGNADQR
jgi:hypothetical protein